MRNNLPRERRQRTQLYKPQDRQRPNNTKLPGQILELGTKMYEEWNRNSYIEWVQAASVKEVLPWRNEKRTNCESVYCELH